MPNVQVIRVSTKVACFPLARITYCAGRHIVAMPVIVPMLHLVKFRVYLF
jgi:hypothetical protein